MKKHHTSSYDELIAKYYGGKSKKVFRDLKRLDEPLGNDYGKPLRKWRKGKSHAPKVSVSKSFDNGEVLVQQSSHNNFEEYVLASSIVDAQFEEYVIDNVEIETGPALAQSMEFTPVETVDAFEEYTVDVMSPLEASPDVTSAPISAPASVVTSGSEECEECRQKQPTFSVPKSADPSPTEEDFMADMQSILTGQKIYDPVSKATVERDSLGRQQTSRSQSSDQSQDQKNEYEIFDRIAKSMQYANAYDLGTVEIDKRLSDFDRAAELETKVKEDKKKNPEPAPTKANNVTVDGADFMEDLDRIAKGRKDDVKLAPVLPGTSPSHLRPHTDEEKQQIFGAFPFEPDPAMYGGDGIKVLNGWKEDNIISVDIPQLNGKKIESTLTSEGKILFHRLGADKLRQLWSAWEAAGLLSKVITFDGSYIPKFIRNTQDRNPRPLSSHAWGIAFDINTNWNPSGSEPAEKHAEGSVHELVAIANQHGFFWGGHYEKDKAGAHFELGKMLP